MKAAYVKAAIPHAVRRALAARHGCLPGESVEVPCHYCGKPGEIWWPRLHSGKPGKWVTFDHEMDHVIPEFHGGPTTADNIVLACRRCNRSKGARL